MGLAPTLPRTPMFPFLLHYSPLHISDFFPLPPFPPLPSPPNPPPPNPPPSPSTIITVSVDSVPTSLVTPQSHSTNLSTDYDECWEY